MQDNIVSWLSLGKPLMDPTVHGALMPFVTDFQMRVPPRYNNGEVTLTYYGGDSGLAWKYNTATHFLSRDLVVFWDSKEFFEISAGKFRWYLHERLIREAGDVEMEAWEKAVLGWNNLTEIINKCIPVEGVFA